MPSIESKSFHILLLKSIFHNLKKTFFFFKMDILKDMWYQNNDVAMSWTNLKGEWKLGGTTGKKKKKKIF